MHRAVHRPEVQGGRHILLPADEVGEIVEIPAALGGKLVDISVKPGQNIRQGDTIAWIEREA